MSWAFRLEPGDSGVKARRVCRFPYRPSGASGPARTGCLPFTRRPLYLVSYEGIVSPVRFERTLPSASCWCLLPVGLEDIGAAVRCRSGPPALRGRGRSRARRRRYRGWNRTSVLLIQSQGGMPTTHPVPGTGGEIRTLTRPDLSRPGIPSSHHARVPPRGLEPLHARLRVWCPASRAQAAYATWSGMQESNPHSRLGGPAH
jgi:hypothetical protein